jgi:predicted PurR-regulated permease PerM
LEGLSAIDRKDLLEGKSLSVKNDAHEKPFPRVPGQEPVVRTSARTTTAVLLVVAVFIWLVRSILLPFVVAGAVAYISTPAVDWLARRIGGRRMVAVAAVFLLVLGLVVSAGFFAVPMVLHEVLDLSSDLGKTIEDTARTAIGDRTVSIAGQPMNAAQIAKGAVDALHNWLTQAGKVFGVFLTLTLLFYFLAGGRRLANGLVWLVPPKQRPLILAIWAQLDPVLKRYFIGIAVVVTYAMIAAYIGLGLVLGLRHAILLAMLTGFLEMIPVVGPASSAIIAGIFAIQSADSIWSIVAYAIYASALRLSIDQLVGPVVLGRAAAVTPVLIIFCFLTGGILFGVPGVILAVPVALTIKIVLATLYQEPVEAVDESQEGSA